MEQREREALAHPRIQDPLPSFGVGVGSFSSCSSQPFRLMAGEAGLLAAGGLASSPSVGVPLTPPFSWTGNSCRGDQPGLVSGH